MLAVAISGCAIKATPVQLSSQDPPQVLLCGNAHQATLGIAPLVDKRPVEERRGHRPGGIFLLLWNQRIGDYISGDRDFTESTAKVLPEQIGYAIARTNCFFETKVLSSEIPEQPKAEELLVLFAREKLNYVLMTELNHSYGKQHQKAYFYVTCFYGNETEWR